jgi:hypothetical protein
MKNKLILAATIGVLLATSVAEAQGKFCGQRTKIVSQIKKIYSEQLVSVGKNKGGQMVEVYRAVDKNTWTIIATSPNGFSCIVQAGSDWLIFREKEEETKM